MNIQPRHSPKFFSAMLVAILTVSLFISEAIVAEAETVDPSTFRDLTILSGQSEVEAIDGDHNTVWSVSFNGWDKEMLPNGNLLLTYGQMEGPSTIREVNITTNQIVWEIDYVDGMPLSFTHEADWLGVDQFGQDIFLIADTDNDRVVEFFRNGTVIWSWYAEDHYSYPHPNAQYWTRINDADRLPDGTTMISLMCFNIIAIVNTTESGEVLWEYGVYKDDTILASAHNPEYTPRGTLLIADTAHHRIIEVNMTTKEIIWEYAPTGNDALGMPRDADLLPNGNMLICANTILEINTTTKEVVWRHETGGFNYDADRLDTVLPTVNILSPTATTYDGVAGVPISLSCDDPWYDEMTYRIYDETADKWLTDQNVTYDGATEVFLENQRTYTLYAWAKDLVMEGGACPTSRAIVQLEEASVQFTTSLDETAPEISDVNVTAEADITFNATVTDDISGVKQVTLNYVYVNDNGTWNNDVDMANIEGDVWSAVIPAFPNNTTLAYTISAEDNAGNIATIDEMEYDYTIPEYSSWLLPSLLLVATLIIVIYKKKLLVGSRGFEQGTNGDITRFYPANSPFFNRSKTWYYIL
jgi:hypothetical protein